MGNLFIIIGFTSLLTVLFALSFAYFIYRKTQHRLVQITKTSDCCRP